MARTRFSPLAALRPSSNTPGSQPGLEARTRRRPRLQPPQFPGLGHRRPSWSPRRCRSPLSRRGDGGAGGGGGLPLAAPPFNQGYYQTRLAGWRRRSFTPISAGRGGGWAPRSLPVRSQLQGFWGAQSKAEARGLAAAWPVLCQADSFYFLAPNSTLTSSVTWGQITALLNLGLSSVKWVRNDI